MLEGLLVELSRRVKHVTTLSTRKVNRVESVDQGIQVETDTSETWGRFLCFILSPWEVRTPME